MGKGKDNGNYKHGLRHTTEYNSYANARQRCNNPKNPDFKYYGGRSIKFTFSSFQDFYAEIGPRPDGMTLDRIDNEKGYQQGNIVWRSRTAQNRNKRNVKLDHMKAEAIRKRYAKGDITLRILGREYNVAFGHISAIVRNKYWNEEEAA